MRRFAAAFGVAVALVTCLAGPGVRAADTLTVAGRLAERPIPTGARNPSRLETGRRVLLELSVANFGAQDVNIGTVLLRGRVIGLTFFNYETSVAIAVPAGSTVTRQFALDLSGLKGQAVGLFNAEIKLLDQQRQAVASRRTVVDVRGSWRSVYSLFGIALVVATAAAFVRATLDLARHRLSPNRWRRGVRFLVPGLGLGLTLVFTLSAFRAYLPGPMAAIPIVLIPAALGFALGYFTPTPDDGEGLDRVPAPAAAYDDPLP
jgi:hypothetical protein